MKKSLAVMLALIMVLCMIPTTALAADIIGQKNNDVYIYKGEPQNSYFLRQIDGGSITKSKNEEVIWQRLPRYTSKCGRCNNVVEEVIPDLYCINPDKNIEITNPEVIGEYGVRVASWKGNDVYNGYPCFEFYCKAAKAGETDVKVTYYYNYNYPGESGYCKYCGNFVNVQAQTSWYKESVTFHVKFVDEDPVGIPDKPTDISGIVGDKAVKVHCTTNNSHADNTYGLISGSFTIGDVTKDTTSGNYTCTITVQPGEYVKAYNGTYLGHTLETEGQTGTINLKWNENKWEVVSGVPVVFNVKCDNTQPSTDKPEKPEPENTSKPVAGLTSKDAVEVECITKNSGHAKQAYQLIADSYDVGAVSGNKEKGYTCEITVKPEKYVTQYNLDIEVEHKLVRPENYTITLNWDAADGQWKYTENKLPVTFTVMCEVQPPLDKTIPIEVSKTWHDDSGAVVKPEKITVNLLKNGTVVENAPIMPDNEGTWFHRFDNMPANDINDNPINYTVKEEDVPGWTPYYWTAGPSNDKLFFQIHNVPTKNTREIKVTKTVSGEGADKAKYFDFKVTLLEYHDNAEVTDQPGYYPLGGTYTFGGVTFTNGVATFKLKDGESFEITGIPSHIYSNLPLQYKVEEIAPSGYTVKVNGSAGMPGGCVRPSPTGAVQGVQPRGEPGRRLTIR